MDSICNLNTAFVRMPYYSYQEYLKIPDKIEELDLFIIDLWNKPMFKEALYIASQDLYYEWKKIRENSNYPTEKKRKVHQSILKYFTRASTRSTPFGLFSSYSLIEINSPDYKQDVIIDDNNNNTYNRFTTLDFSYLNRLVQYLNNNSVIRKLLRYELNNTIYKTGKTYRYVENNLENEYILNAIDSDEVLELLINECREFKTIRQLSTILLENIENIDEQDAIEYIDELINAQILKSDFDISLTECSPFNQIILFLKKTYAQISNNTLLNEIYLSIYKLDEKIKELDSSIENDIIRYEKLYKVVDKIGVKYDKKNLIRVNLKKNQNSIDINSSDIYEIKEAMLILSFFKDKLNDINEGSNLDKFKKAYLTRYEDKEMPLSIILDNDIGLGYPLRKNSTTITSNLINKIKLRMNESDIDVLSYNKKTHLFWKKLLNKALLEKAYTIDIKNENFSGFTKNIDKFSRTFSASIKKVNDKFLLEYVGNSSALNLIARFTSLDSDLKLIVNDILANEGIDDSEIIHAELLHLPNKDVGNIVARSVERKHEVPYFNNICKNSNKILIEDILISIKENRVVLRSKSLNKLLKIYNTNAHTISQNSLPFYQFIGDLQYQDSYNGMFINIEQINKEVYDFIPRIIIGSKIILSPATWKLNFEDIKLFYDKNKEIIHKKEFKKYINSKQIPRYIYINQLDNYLLIDTDKECFLKILFDEIEKRKFLSITECLSDVSEDYSDNEIILSFANKTLLKTKHEFVDKNNTIKRRFIPGDDWIYYKIYTGEITANKILVDALYPLIKLLKQNDLIDQWFFIRYVDSDFHIRIRFLYNKKTNESLQKIILLFNKHLEYYSTNNLVWKIELSTYDREIERYNDNTIESSEMLFHQDSELVLALMNNAKKQKTDEILWKYSLRCIDKYFDLFKINLESRYKIIQTLYESYSNEFVADKDIKKQIDMKYRENLESLTHIISSTNNHNKSLEYLIDTFINKNLYNYTYIQDASSLITSFIHMHINRMIISNPRMHELVMYGILEKYYRMKISQKKHLI